MKSIFKIIIQIFSISIFITSCDFDDSLIEYEQQLVVFASINAGLPVSDTIYVSRTAEVDEPVDAQDLYIENATVKLINMSDSSELDFYSIGNGRYYPIDLSMQNIDSVSRYWLAPSSSRTLSFLLTSKVKNDLSLPQFGVSVSNSSLSPVFAVPSSSKKLDTDGIVPPGKKSPPFNVFGGLMPG